MFNINDVKIGDTLYAITRNVSGKYGPEVQEVSVVKKGRKYLYVEKNGEKNERQIEACELENCFITSGDAAKSIKYYLTRQEAQDEVDRDWLWPAVIRTISGKKNVIKIEDLRAIAEILGVTNQ